MRHIKKKHLPDLLRSSRTRGLMDLQGDRVQLIYVKYFDLDQLAGEDLGVEILDKVLTIPAMADHQDRVERVAKRLELAPLGVGKVRAEAMNKFCTTWHL